MADDIKVFIGCLILIGFVGVCFGALIQRSQTNQELIERGLKEYDAKTGQLIWVEPIKEGDNQCSH